jgi:hypothetical protein
MADSKPDLQRMRVKHHAIAQYLLANPTTTQKEIAAEFGISQAWLSIVINSDCFREYLANADAEFRHEVLIPLREKLVGVASRAVEKVGEALEVGSPDYALEVADMALHKLGYAPNKGPEVAVPPGGSLNVQQNNYYVDKDTLRHARGRMLEVAQQGPKEKAPDALPAPEELPTS